jgi:Protein of unknown function (DUF962)
MSQQPPANPPRFPRLHRRLEGWRLRHQLPINFWLHMVGIPLALGGAILFLVLPRDQWYYGAAMFVAGYFLQWVGHRCEGNDLGEWAAIKRALGLPYIGIAPRWNHHEPDRL